MGGRGEGGRFTGVLMQLVHRGERDVLQGSYTRAGCCPAQLPARSRQVHVPSNNRECPKQRRASPRGPRAAGKFRVPTAAAAEAAAGRRTRHGRLPQLVHCMGKEADAAAAGRALLAQLQRGRRGWGERGGGERPCGGGKPCPPTRAQLWRRSQGWACPGRMRGQHWAGRRTQGSALLWWLMHTPCSACRCRSV